MNLIPGKSREDTGVTSRERIALNHSVADFCLAHAARCIERQSMEEALKWDLIAARVLSFDCAVLTSPELEKQLVQIGASIQVPVCGRTNEPKVPKSWLHVLTEVCGDGGHGATVARWIRNDPGENIHSIVLLGQTRPLPESLIEVVQHKSGAVIRMDDPGESLLSRSARLRELVWSRFDVVILHTHPWDVIATVAFAVPGGPPVLLLNHGAHIFWAGGSIADMILNIRHSPDEDEWTVQYRGIDRIRHLPIPLPEPAQTDYSTGMGSDAGSMARKALGLPDDALVLLTVGNSYKYKAVRNIDFFKAIEPVLNSRPEVYLLAAGPEESGSWKKLREATGGRALAFGVQADLSVFHAAADLYLEGFPFGSTTALLEAGLKGIPAVLPPGMCPPPFVTDGIAVQCLQQSSWAA